MSEKLQLTKEQQTALECKGEAIVSASAGSGKTFVMIKKITDLILSGSCGVNDILAVTFTKMAANQMKDKLKESLIKKINEVDEGERARLSNELFLVNSADISTIHSLCAKLLKRYFFAVDINVNSTIIDDEEANALRNRAIEMLFEEKYKNGDADFVFLLKIFAQASKNYKLKNEILKLYYKVVSIADYENTLRKTLERYDEKYFEEICSELLLLYKKRLGLILSLYEEAFCECKNFEKKVFEKYIRYFEERLDFIKELKSKDDFFSFANTIPPKFSMKPKVAEKLKDDAKLVAFDLKLKEIGKTFKLFIDGYIKKEYSKEEELAKFLNSKETAKAMTNLLLEFASLYQKLKRESFKLDFNDLEHYTLKLLSNENYRKQIAGSYKYIFIDEYQDVNPVQEAILSKLSTDNEFMVGDIKQSIYAFRGCKSDFFSNKFSYLNSIDKNALTLNANFRSSKQVVDAVNKVFCEIMTTQTAGLDYANSSLMVFGSKNTNGSYHIHCTSTLENEKKEVDEVYSVRDNVNAGKDKSSSEGKLITNLILNTVGKKDYKDRKYTFGDIVILVRNTTAKTKSIITELTNRGIPVSSRAEVNICQYSEIKQLIEILKYIDCPNQDIPLATTLKSPIANFSNEMLAQIRLYARENYPFTDTQPTFYECVEFYRQNQNDEISKKLNQFVRFMHGVKVMSTTSSVKEVFEMIISQKNFEFYYLTLPCGELRLRRVKRFLDEMRPNGVDLNIKGFLLRLKNLDYDIGLVEAGGLGAVRVLSIHASKGLEFPMVICAGMNNSINTQDSKSLIFFEDEYGIVTHSYNTQSLVRGNTLLRLLMNEKRKLETSKNEMFLFYVAMTRAQNDLHLIFTKRENFLLANVPYAKSYANFVNINDEELDDVPCVREELEKEKRQFLASYREKEKIEEIAKKLAFEYTDERFKESSLDTTASKLVALEYSEFVKEDMTEKNVIQLSDEDVIDTDKKFKANERGTAYHKFLELIDFNNINSIEDELDKNSSSLESYKDLLSTDKLQKILSMDCFTRIKGLKIMQECDFATTLDGKALLLDYDKVFVTGSIDLLAVGDNECYIYDYKFTSKDKESLKTIYLPQLRLYSEVVKKSYPDKKIKVSLINIKKQEEIFIEI